MWVKPKEETIPRFPSTIAKKVNITIRERLYIITCWIMCPWTTCPNSWFTTATISSFECCAISVSNKTTLRKEPKPETKALEWLERLEPSMTLISATPTSQACASATIAFLKSPSSRSEKSKNIGTITVGTSSDTIRTMTIDVPASVRTIAFPDMAISQSRSGMTIAIMIMIRRNFLISSHMKVAIVVLLKPYFSSMWKVE